MPAIVAEALTKTYRYHRKAPGLRGSLASLVRRESLQTRAVDGSRSPSSRARSWASWDQTAPARPPPSRCCAACSIPAAGRPPCWATPHGRRERAYLRRMAW